jgi:hypothetical protein
MNHARPKLASRLVGTVAVAAAVIGLAACELPETILLEVNSTAPGHDANPGDGVCETVAGAGDCTLEAAFDEGNAHETAQLSVPPGTYAGMDLVATGSLRVNWNAPTDGVILNQVDLSVAPSGFLSADGLRVSISEDGLETGVQVDGALHLRRSVVSAFDDTGNAGVGVTVADDAGVVLDRSIVQAMLVGVRNEGRVVAVQSTLATAASTPRVLNEGDGETLLTSSFLTRLVNTGVIGASCTGTTVSHGHNASQATPTSGCDPTATDLTFFTIDLATVGGLPAPRTPTVGLDLIPVGQAGCSPTATDLLGNPRAVDSDGDGTAGCEPGALEVPAPDL